MIELLVNGNRVDLGEGVDIALNKSIIDIGNHETRSSDFSKTITIPGTSHNNKVFNHILTESENSLFFLLLKRNAVLGQFVCFVEGESNSLIFQ